MCPRPWIDRYRCNGCGSCVSLCPDLFEWDEEICEIKIRDVDEFPEDKLRDAFSHCPNECLFLDT